MNNAKSSSGRSFVRFKWHAKTVLLIHDSLPNKTHKKMAAVKSYNCENPVELDRIRYVLTEL